ncbi:MAG: amidohydrolase family protein [Actinomycetota bacterium]
MTTPIERIVDAHLHFWDPARTDWYPYLSGGMTLDIGDISGMCRRFLPEDYRAEAAAWPVDKVIHVSAAGTFIAEETREREAMGAATGDPAAIIGGIRSDQSPAEAIALLDDQMASSRFRGVRTMGVDPGGVPHPDVLAALVERNLVFDLMVHPDLLAPAAATLAGWGDLTVVLEHTGWPRSSDPDERALWEAGITALGALDHVHCKLSGLAMPLGSTDAEAFRPWIEYALEVFGVDRCFFASNFPVDSTHGTFDELFATFDRLTADLGADARAKLFATNAESVYRC